MTSFLKSYFGFHLSSLFAFLPRRTWQGEFQIVIKPEIEPNQPTIPNFPGLGESNDLLKKIGIYDYFEYVAGSDTFDYCKPDPRHLTTVVEILDGDLKKTIMIGDSETDADAARGADTVSYTHLTLPTKRIV